MAKVSLWILILWEIVIANAHLSPMNNDFYTAAVVEFSLPTPPNKAVSKPKVMIETSLNEYLRLINEAGESEADIVVFPEGSLNYIGVGTRQQLRKYAIELKNSDIFNSTSFDNSCDYSKKSSIISKISFAARTNKIYVLINVIERSECEKQQANESCDHALFSTNIVFDRRGCVVSRYRKFNTKMDPLLNSTLLPEVQIFHTDFDVSFGHFTSQDILTKYPAYIMLQSGIRHVLFPASWHSSLPFYTSLQVQQSYSYANNIVLLAASANSPVSGHGGSGIFIGRNGAAAMLLTPESTQQLILSRIPKEIDTFSMHIEDNVVKRYNFKQLDELFISQIPVSYTETLPGNSKWDVRRLCKEKICCEFSMRHSKLEVSKDKSKYVYKLTASSGWEKFIDAQSKELYCAVVACTTDSPTSCGKRFQPSEGLAPSIKFHEIKIKMIVELESTENDYLVMPTNVDFFFLPLGTSQYGFKRSKVYTVNNKKYINYTTTLMEERDDLVTFGILGRTFQLDEFIGDEATWGMFYLLISLFIGLFTTFAVIWILRIK